MKYILMVLMIFAVVVEADTLRIDYGYGSEGRTGYDHLDTAIILHYSGNTIDTLLGPLYDTTTAIDTFFVITGTGTHWIVLYAVADGYANQWYEAKVWKLTLSLAATTGGLGSDRVTIYAVDSSGTDVAISGVALTFKDASGNDIGFVQTKSGGYEYFNWIATDTVFLTGLKPGYVFTGMADGTDDSLIITGTQTDTIYGYNIAIGAPSGDSLCRVYGYAASPEDGSLIEGAVVTWSLKGRNIYDVCNGNAIVKINGSTPSDVNGLWMLDLLYSQCLQRSSTASTSDSILYEIVIDYPGGSMVQNKSFNVPSADSVAFTW